MKILILNGVNLGILGRREPEIYGRMTLAELNKEVKAYAAEKGVSTAFFQTDSETVLVRKINNCKHDAVILNPGAYSHYSYAIRDAVAAARIPIVEVHLSDIQNREAFRKNRVLDGIVSAAFWGDGVKSYFKAIDFLSR